MSNQIVVRFEPSIKEWRGRPLRLRGEDLSDLVRRAVKMELARLSFLSEREKKALGLEIKETQNHERFTCATRR